MPIGISLQGYLAHENPPPPVGPYSCPGTYGDPRGVGVSYERGTPVLVIQGGWVFLMSEVPLYCRLLRPGGPQFRGTPVQGYLAHEKSNPPRTTTWPHV